MSQAEEPLDGMPEPPKDGESWDQVAARVQAEIVNAAYASSLAASMQAYLNAGFSYNQAWDLTLAEHTARLDLMNQMTLMQVENGEGA